MKRIPPGQLDRIGRQLERLHETYIKRWLDKGYIGAEVFDQQFCKLFDMINAEVDGASGVASQSRSYRQRSMDSFTERDSCDDDDEDYSDSPRAARGHLTPHRTPYPPSASSASRRIRSSSGYKPKSSFYRRRSSR